MPLKDTNGQTFLTVTCSACKAVYRAYRRVNPEPYTITGKIRRPNDKPNTINYCMFCGYTPVTIGIESNEQDWIDGVADKYNITPTKVRALLEIYESAPPTAKLSWQKLLGAKQ